MVSTRIAFHQDAWQSVRNSHPQPPRRKIGKLPPTSHRGVPDIGIPNDEIRVKACAIPRAIRVRQQMDSPQSHREHKESHKAGFDALSNLFMRAL